MTTIGSLCVYVMLNSSCSAQQNVFRKYVIDDANTYSTCPVSAAVPPSNPKIVQIKTYKSEFLGRRFSFVYCTDSQAACVLNVNMPYKKHKTAVQ